MCTGSSSLPNGDRQMFIARVAAGRAELRTPDGSIRHPSGGFHTVVGTPIDRPYLALGRIRTLIAPLS